MRVSISVEGGGKLRSKKISKALDGMSGNIRTAITESQLLVEGDLKEKFLRGQVLHVRTNRLRSSITHTSPRLGNRGWYGLVGTNVKYAPIHEFGGTIEPKKDGGWLRFKIGGDWVSVKKVVIPKRPFMMPALKTNLNNIRKIFVKHIARRPWK